MVMVGDGRWWLRMVGTVDDGRCVFVAVNSGVS